MRREYKQFAVMVLVTFIISLIRNVNILLEYKHFGKEYSEVLFGLSYTIPFAFCGYFIYRRSKFFWERVISLLFFFIALSALMDEVLFDPFKPEIWEHLAAIVSLFIIYFYERFKEARD